jgi:hypothetical protein
MIQMSDYISNFSGPIVDWLSNNPTKRPSYVVLFQDLPSRLYDGSLEVSVQYDMAIGYNPLFQISDYSPSWNPFVTSINMNGTNGTSDCTAYIDKLVSFSSNYSPGQLKISASAGGYNNTNWYIDYTGDPNYAWYGRAITAEYGITNADPTASVIGTSGSVLIGLYYFTNFTMEATNVGGYFTAGWDGGFGDTNMFVDGLIRFYGQSGWYIMSTIDSFSGQRGEQGEFLQASFLSWYSTNSFGGTNYSNTPVGGITYVDEPGANQLYIRSLYYGGWAAGKTFANSAWACLYQNGPVEMFQAVGDPFVIK